MAGSADLQDVLTVIIDALRDVLNAERASVFQYDADAHEFYATRAHGLPGDMRLSANRGLIGEAKRTLKLINVADVSTDQRFDPTISKATGFAAGALLTLPLIDEAGTLVGVAQVLHRAENGSAFSETDEELAQHLAAQAAMALRRATLFEAERRRDELEAEMRIARLIQVASLPKTLPDVAGWSLAAHSAPATEAAGDAYDAAFVDGTLWIFMADATGHGVGPALSVSQTLAMMRMGIRIGASLEEIAQQINRQCAIDLPHGRFVTAFMGVVDPEVGILHFVSAGQAPILIMRHARGECETLGANAPPLGVDKELTLDPAPPVHLAPGDALVLISDGIFEARANGGHPLGALGVMQAVQEGHPYANAESMLDVIVRATATHCAGASAEDDQTALIVQHTAKSRS